MRGRGYRGKKEGLSEYEGSGLEAGFDEGPKLMLLLVPVADTEAGLT